VIEFGGWFLPVHEKHLQGWMAKVNDKRDGRLAYQGAKLDTLFSLCKDFRNAVDVGGHCGLLSFYLGKKFDAVFAFEPSAEHRACFAKNVHLWPHGNVKLHPFALGEKEGFVDLHTTPGSSGDSWVKPGNTIPIKRLDDIIPEDVQIDALKADCEGSELFVLRGAEKTLLRCKPALMIEQKPGKGSNFGLKDTAAVDYLQSLGATLRKEMSGDYFFTWD
jgi:FkbM family methyltransferase